jgi:hypothetical protein
MTPAQEARNWRKLCGGNPAPKLKPAPVPFVLVAPETITLLHPERLKDPRYAWKRVARGGYVERLRKCGFLIESRLQEHWRLAAAQNPDS